MIAVFARRAVYLLKFCSLYTPFQIPCLVRTATIFPSPRFLGPRHQKNIILPFKRKLWEGRHFHLAPILGTSKILAWCCSVKSATCGGSQAKLHQFRGDQTTWNLGWVHIYMWSKSTGSWAGRQARWCLHPEFILGGEVVLHCQILVYCSIPVPANTVDPVKCENCNNKDKKQSTD